MNPFPRLLASFESVTLLDSEFDSSRGNRPSAVCLVTRDYKTGTVSKYWRNELYGLRACPFPHSERDLVVAYYASADLGFMLNLGWTLPCNVLDLFAEHRVETNGRYLPVGNGLVGALAMRGLPHMESAAKAAMRDKILNRHFWSPSEKEEILDYCTQDVSALKLLLDAMLPSVDLPRALLRGRYTAAVARMEASGIPVDLDLQRSLSARWRHARLGLVQSIDERFGVYDGLTFKRSRFSQFLRQHSISWPRSGSGLLKLDDDTFKQQARLWPILSPLRELRRTLNGMHILELQIGNDGRARTLLSPFASKTGRNQPSAKRFAFNFSAWQRGIVKPPEGWGLSYIDFSSQEICVAAGLSKDDRLAAAYKAGDPYLAFAKQSGLAPSEATRESHAAVRDLCKTVVLGINYGLGVEGLAQQAAIAPALATELIQRHKATYPVYWRWVEDTLTAALLSNQMTSVFGWRREVTSTDRPTSLMNFPMQANGAEMMRLAAIAATEAGIEVCAPVHDAFLIAAPINELDDRIAQMRDIMTRAGIAITGLPTRTDANTIRFPERYMDARGMDMWNRVVQLINRPELAFQVSH